MVRKSLLTSCADCWLKNWQARPISGPNWRRPQPQRFVADSMSLKSGRAGAVDPAD